MEEQNEVFTEIKNLSYNELIDLRNQHWTLCEIKNCFKEPEAQKELTESGEELYFNGTVPRCYFCF